MRLAGYKFHTALFLCLLLLKFTLTTSPDCTIHIVVSEVTVHPEVSLRFFSYSRYYHNQLNSSYFCILFLAITKTLMAIYACE